MSEGKKYLDATGLTHLVGKIKEALSGKADTGAVQPKGEYATLDENGMVPAEQLPSYVDDVVEYDRVEDFPTVGEKGKIYVAVGTNLTYRWSGSTYVEISKSLALGETSQTAYAGDKGAKNATDIATLNNTIKTKVNASDWQDKNDMVARDLTDIRSRALETLETSVSDKVLSIKHTKVSGEEAYTYVRGATTVAAGLMTAEDKKKLEEQIYDEGTRVANERDRNSAEETRHTNEAQRLANEKTRQDNETARTAAEEERGEVFNEKTAALDTALKNCETATAGAEQVDAVIEDDVLKVTDREGAKKEVSLVTQARAEEIAEDTERMKRSLGVYSDRPDIVLTAKQTNVAISKDGVKVAKQGWAIAEFTAELGNEYLFKPGVTDGEVCVFAEYIDKVETRAIDYQTTYDESGRVKTATATYNGKTYTYTYDYSQTTTVITDQDGQRVQELPGVYTTTVGSYSVLTRLNEGAELPTDGYCRFVSNFQAAAAIKVVVSYKVGSADLTMKVVRDGMVASMCTQLSKINKKVDDVAQSVPKMWINVCAVEDTYLIVDGKRLEIPAHKNVIIKEPQTIDYQGDGTTVGFFKDIITRFDIHYNGLYKMQRLKLNRDGYWQRHTGVTTLDVSGLDTSEMTNMRSMLFGIVGVTALDVSGFDTSKVANMESMFCNCQSLAALDVSGFDTSKVVTLKSMFFQCYKLSSIDVSKWNVENVTNCSQTFSSTGLAGLDLSSWNLINNTTLDASFENSNKLTTIKGNNLCTGKVRTIRAIFDNCSSLTTLDVSGWDTSSVVNMYSAFQNCSSLTTLDVSGWDTGNVTDAHNMFFNCGKLVELDFSNWNLSEMAYITRLTEGCRSLATLTFGEGFGKMKDECGTLDLSDLVAWKNDSVKSLLTLYDRKANGMGVITIKLHANAKAVLGEEGIEELTAKGYTIA